MIKVDIFDRSYINVMRNQIVLRYVYDRNHSKSIVRIISVTSRFVVLSYSDQSIVFILVCNWGDRPFV
jgi:hypothetical protein